MLNRHKQDKTGPTGPRWTSFFHFSDWILNLSCVYGFLLFIAIIYSTNFCLVVYCVKRQTNLLWTCLMSTSDSINSSLLFESLEILFTSKFNVIFLYKGLVFFPGALLSFSGSRDKKFFSPRDFFYEGICLFLAAN